MSLHEKPKYNTEAIHMQLKAHGLALDQASIVSDAFRLGWVVMRAEALDAIATLPTPTSEDVMSGHEDAFRCVEKIDS